MKYSNIPISYYMDYEEPAPAPQPRCKCGRFLSWKPNGTTRFTEPNGHWDYDLDVWVQDGPDFVGEIEPVWICSCGEHNLSQDIFE